MLINEVPLVKQSPGDKLMMASFTATIAALLMGPLRKNKAKNDWQPQYGSYYPSN